MSRRRAARLLSRCRATISRFHGSPIVSCSLASRSRLPFAKDSFDQSTSAGLPAGEKPGSQARSRVRELRDDGSAVDLSRDRVQRRQPRQSVQPDVRFVPCAIDESRANVTSSSDTLSSLLMLNQRRETLIVLSS